MLIGEQWLRKLRKKTELNYPIHVNAPIMFTVCHFVGGFPSSHFHKYLVRARSYHFQKDICNNSFVRMCFCLCLATDFQAIIHSIKHEWYTIALANLPFIIFHSYVFSFNSSIFFFSFLMKQIDGVRVHGFHHFCPNLSSTASAMFFRHIFFIQFNRNFCCAGLKYPYTTVCTPHMSAFIHSISINTPNSIKFDIAIQ